MKVKFRVLGCKSNIYDANNMKAMFQAKNYEIVQKGECDIAVLLSCCVTNESERKCRQNARRLKGVHPNALVVISGCYAQIKGDELVEDGLCDIAVKTSDIADIVEIIERYLKDKNIHHESSPLESAAFAPWENAYYPDKTRATIKIQDGCNMFCTYCIIPFARGPIRSRSLEDIISQVTKTAKEGYKEVVITGIHLASYNFNGNRLIDVVREISKVEGIQRIRLGSLEPHLLSEPFLKELSQIESFCDHFHISIQSGDDKVLRDMNRHYDSNFVLDTIERVREYFPNSTITTDIIVGFPTEQEEAFNNTLQFVQKANLYHIHIFPFSKKQGTKAAAMEETLSAKQKHERVKALSTIQREIKKSINSLQVGKTVEILTETPDKNGLCHGYTKNYMKVVLNASLHQNELVKAKITSFDEECLYGELI